MDSFAPILNDIRNQADPGEAFEKLFCKWFLENDPYWKTQVKQVWLWDDWPGRWGKDKGIDLIFKHKNGETWAVQAKCYKEEYSITKTDIDKFLSESNRPQIHKRLLMATTNRLGPNTIEVMDGQEKMVVRYLLDDFRNSGLEYPTTLSQLNKPSGRVQLEVRPYQKAAITGVLEGLKSYDRGQLIMACGTGKTLVTLWVKEQLESTTTLILLPSLNLLAQTLQEWTKNADVPFEVLNVCSDSTVGKRERSEDLEVTEAPFNVTSDVSVITTFLQLQEPKVIFCTYQSADLIAAAQGQQVIDLMICDEAHRCAGSSASPFTMVLDNNVLKANKRLFTTATPRIFSLQVSKAAEERGDVIYGMDDEEVFGPVFYHYSFGQAIADGWLSDYQVAIVGVDEPTVMQYIQDRELLRLSSGETANAEDLAIIIGLLKAVADFDLCRVISFHSRVKAAKNFAQDYLSILGELEPSKRPSGSIGADYVDGEMPTQTRRSKLQYLSILPDVDRGLLANARCLSEGVDVPALDGVAFIDPKGSQIDIIQAVGRALRLSGSKTKGTIILPVFLQQGDDPEVIINKSNFKLVGDVLRALRAHDDELAEELDTYRFNLGKRTGFGSQTLRKVVVDLPQRFDESFESSLETRIVELTTASWEFWYGLLTAYVESHGDALVPQSFTTADGFALGSWVHTQRKNREKLSREKVRSLNEIGFIWEVIFEQWDKGFAALVSFVKEYSHARVPRSHETNRKFPLGNWVHNQRIKRKSLAEEKIDRLNSIGFSWDPNAEIWEEGFAALEEYVKRESHAEVPMRYKTAEDFRLGSWVQRQRKNREKLSLEQVDRLDRLGFVWDPIAEKWEEGFAALVSFVKEYSHARVPRSHETNRKFPLGNWVGTQRRNKDKLSKELIERLDRLGFVWDPNAEIWEEGFAALEEYVKRESHAEVPMRYKTAEDFRLGSWVQRQRKNREKLSLEQVDRLDRLGFVWDPIAEKWEEGFAALVSFVKEYSHARVLQDHINQENFQLGKWVSTQRSRKKELSNERIDRLNSIGFIWNADDLKWAEGYERLVKYTEEHSNTRVHLHYKTTDNYPLGNWVSNQRNRKNKLPKERIDLLNSIGFIWDTRK